MAAVPITINGVMYPKTKEAGAKPVPCTFVGYAWITGLRPDHGLPETPPTEPPVTEPPPESTLDQMFTMVLKEAPASGGWGFYPEQGGWLYRPSGAGPKKK